MRTLPLLMILAGLPAMAADPAQETPVAPAEATAPASVPAPAASATPESPAAPAATPAPVAAATPTKAAKGEEFKPPKDYKVKTRKGETVYCRSQTTVGTRFPTEFCFTQVDLERIEKNKRSIQQDVSMRTKMCTTGSACSGGG
jgi:cytoskeletal protein RodZ